MIYIGLIIIDKVMLKDFIHIFVLSCKKATFLIEKRLHVPLSPLERWQLKVHLHLCKFCTAYSGKAVFLHKIMKQETEQEQCNCQFHTEEVEKFREEMKGEIRTREKEKGAL